MLVEYQQGSWCWEFHLQFREVIVPSFILFIEWPAEFIENPTINTTEWSVLTETPVSSSVLPRAHLTRQLSKQTLHSWRLCNASSQTLSASFGLPCCFPHSDKTFQVNSKLLKYRLNQCLYTQKSSLRQTSVVNILYCTGSRIINENKKSTKLKLSLCVQRKSMNQPTWTKMSHNKS